MPTVERFATSQLLRVGGGYYLIDCGEGTQLQLQRFHAKQGHIQQIFISHLHGDHFYGLFGLLGSLALNGKKSPLQIFSPKGLQEIFEALAKHSYLHLPYEITFTVVNTEQSAIIFEDANVIVQSLPLQHRVPAVGYLFKEHPKGRKMLGSAIQHYQIPYADIPAIKAGNDWTNSEGERIDNKLLTTEPSPPRAYAFCSDTIYTETLVPLLQGVDLLYHESTFLHELLPQAQLTMHTTALQAAMIAKKAEVGQLILGHYSARYRSLDPLLEEAQSIFEATVLGEDGLRIQVPKK